MPQNWLMKIVAEVAFAGGFAAFFWYLRRRFPSATPGGDGPTIEELRPKYRKWEIAAGFLAIPMMGVMFLVWWLLFQGVTRWHASWFEPAVYCLRASRGTLALPAMFLGMASAMFLWMGLYRYLLGDRFQEYMRYGSLAAGFDTLRGCTWLFSIMGVLAWLGFILALTWNVVFYEDRILFRSFLGLRTRTVPYADIVELHTAPQLRAPNGNLVNRREYWLDYKGGGTWSTNNDLSMMDLDQKTRLFEFLARKSRKPIVQVPVWE